MPYRRLHASQKFSKYQWIEVGVTKASDPRPESHRISQETIKIKSEVLATTDGWRARKDIIFPLKAETEMRDRFDTHFYVGTINQHPKEWIVVGLFYPLKLVTPGAVQPELF